MTWPAGDPGHRWFWNSLLMSLSLAFGSPVLAETADRGQTLVYAREALLVPGTPAVQNAAILIGGGRIVSIEAPAEPPPAGAGGDGARVIDLSCCYVIPGLIDTQTHLQSQLGLASAAQRLATWTDADSVLRGMIHARRTLQAGFTTVRDMGGHGDAMFALRDAINAGRIPGPRMQVAGKIIQATGGELRAWFKPEVERALQTSAVCDGADDCRRAVRAQVARGSDTIKVDATIDLVAGSASQFTLQELQAIVEEAHRLGVRVTASSFSAQSINLPLQAGVDAVVHGTFADDETLALLHSSAAYFIPTLVAARTVREMAQDPQSPFSAAWRRENLAIHAGMIDSFQRVRAAGLKIAFGTDAGWRPHGGNAEQLLQMVELGMASDEVIASATVHAADAMGWLAEVGTLEVGKYADMVVTAQNPLEDISELTRPLWVLKGGEIVDRRD